MQARWCQHVEAAEYHLRIALLGSLHALKVGAFLDDLGLQPFFSIRKALLISRSLHRDDTKTLKHFRPLYNEDTHSQTKDLKKERHTNNTQSED
jgi:hypothetical protein